MRCVLMNKNTPVLEAEYMSGVGVFTNIYMRCIIRTICLIICMFHVLN